MSLVTPGFEGSREVELDQVSQAQGMRRQAIRRLTGEIPRISAFGDTWSQRSHGSFSLVGRPDEGCLYVSNG